MILTEFNWSEYVVVFCLHTTVQPSQRLSSSQLFLLQEERRKDILGISYL